MAGTASGPGACGHTQHRAVSTVARFPESRCKCGRPIVWAKNTQSGKPIPLDPRPPTYVVTKEQDGGVLAHRAETVMVSHFATCPMASQFSGRNRGG